MTDPASALQSFQVALSNARIRLQPGQIDPDLFVHFDNPNGVSRISYARLERKIVTAFAEFVICEPINQSRCWNVGYAVPEQYRNQGRAKEIVKASISDLQEASARLKVKHFYVEAIVGIENKPSQRVAEQTISDKPFSVTDHVSGLPALQYVRLVTVS